MYRNLLLSGVCVTMILLVVAIVSAGSGGLVQQLQPREPLVIAARYHLRSRTPNFYMRAKQGGHPQGSVKK